MFPRLFMALTKKPGSVPGSTFEGNNAKDQTGRVQLLQLAVNKSTLTQQSENCTPMIREASLDKHVAKSYDSNYYTNNAKHASIP